MNLANPNQNFQERESEGRGKEKGRGGEGRVSRGRKGWTGAVPCSSGPRFVRALHCDPSVLVALHGMAHSFMELHKPLRHERMLIHEGATSPYSKNLDEVRE